MKWLMIPALIALWAPGSMSRAADQTIERSQLPPAVEKTLAEQSKEATIRGIERYDSDGGTLYEVRLTLGGHNRDIVMDESGAIAAIEDEVAFGSLPPVVKAGLQAAAGSGRIVKVEMVTKAGRVSSYKAKVMTGEKGSKIRVDPNGKPLEN
ncbi:MAG: hypothetical protein ACHQ6T_15420 [Myxococcota bacterium]